MVRESPVSRQRTTASRAQQPQPQLAAVVLVAPAVVRVDAAPEGPEVDPAAAAPVADLAAAVVAAVEVADAADPVDPVAADPDVAGPMRSPSAIAARRRAIYTMATSSST